MFIRPDRADGSQSGRYNSLDDRSPTGCSPAVTALTYLTLEGNDLASLPGTVTLSDLVVNDGTANLTLTPTFASDTTT